VSPAKLISTISGWGNYPKANSAILRPERITSIADLVEDLTSCETVIARGTGLAYGDAAINEGGFVLATSRLNKFLSFNLETGVIRCQAGVPLHDIISVALPHGWFLAVTPGTSRATVGGCIACDVHGKNHHVAGSFGNHLQQITLLCGTGEVVTCSPTEWPDLFWASVGGMGLTGIILDATIGLRPVESSWVVTRNIVTDNLDDTLRALFETRNTAYSVAWIDATTDARRRGRGVVMLGDHALRHQVPPQLSDDPLSVRASRRAGVPPKLPGLLRHTAVARTLNNALYRRYALSTTGEHVVPAGSFFYPLDAVENWNRLYGRDGFVEYQAVIPEDRAAPVVRNILDALALARQPSFFSSMKRMGKGNKAPMSFPAEGIAFSFDVPIGEGLFALLDTFDDQVAKAGGRVYLAKDARCRSEVMSPFYPERNRWAELIGKRDPAGKFSSNMARRLNLRAA
jgi:decaprenylphospho-beta-D-ribofuranose 2-oxidase